MNEFKSIKLNARAQVRGHYILLVVACAISIFIGTEFSGLVSDAQRWYDVLTGQVTQLDMDGIREDGEDTTSRILDDLIADNLAAGKEEAARRMQAMQEASDVNSPLGRRRGLLAAALNSIHSGHLYVTVAMALSNLLHSTQAAGIVMLLGGLLVYVAVWVFVRNMYGAILRRICLETRTYKSFPMNHFFHFALVNRWGRVSTTLLVSALYETLWSLTLAGAFIKHYSYFLVPWIAAENPDLKPREVITLSRRMMNGHKWECFLLELSFLGWIALGYLTFGAVDVLWTLPYRMTAYAEYYARLRQQAKAQGIEGAERLNDDCLFTPADPEALRLRYADIVAREAAIESADIPLTPRQRFFARNFGIWMGSMAQKRAYTHQEGLKHQIRVSRLELEGRAYPQRMNALWTARRAKFSGRVSFLTPCTVWSLIAVFFIFCMLGWLWEVSFHLITHGQFANRGVLHGPWLPIYGGGVVMITVLLYRFRSKPMAEAAAVLVLCGAVEYATSWFMERFWGMRWWDYTGYFLNLNGRICGEGLAMFAVGGMVAVYLIVPIIDAMVTRVRTRVLVPVCLALMICFSGDFVYSQFVPNIGEGITDDPEVALMARDTGNAKG